MDVEQKSHLVLARKYRPQNFSTLYGQEALVRTLTNALRSGRLAQAYMLTGVRGVGKTTTARIIARALNCTGFEDETQPEPCGTCANCQAIAADRHPDVLEMDAASRTGIGDVRELIESVRYAPVQARNKVYIIDEVHMLSKQAFNALLKTLEEPPPHVRFIFATTEIRQVPVTILSRCQRFDLKRIGPDVLGRLFQEILDKEKVEAAPEAVTMIARAADGSARDGLSLLDQAIALSSDGLEKQIVEDMLGLADRGQLIDLFKALLQADLGEALLIFDRLFSVGAEPLTLIKDLSDLAHLITRAKVAPNAQASLGLPDLERNLIEEVVPRLSLAVLGRFWQALQKGQQTVAVAHDAKQAGDMVLIGLCHLANVPTPSQLIKEWETADSRSSKPSSELSSNPFAKPKFEALAQQGPENQVIREDEAKPDMSADAALEFVTLADMADFFEAHEEPRLAHELRWNVRLVGLELSAQGAEESGNESHFDGHLSIQLLESAPRTLASQLKTALQRLSGQNWNISLANQGGEDTLKDQSVAAEKSRIQMAMDHPLVQAAMSVFPEAELVEVRETPGNGKAVSKTLLKLDASTDKTNPVMLN